MKGIKRNFSAALCLLLSFALWTAAVKHIDVQAIGPKGSTVGFAALNKFVHSLTGVHMMIYSITDWLGLVPICFAFGFALLGLVQLIKRKSLFKVDFSILVLGVFYIAVIAFYLFFEVFIINFRPVLIGGHLEASYPSSTTMLVMCVMPTAAMQLNARIKDKHLREITVCAIRAFTLFMVTGRLISGVHWFTDIIGGALLSAGLVTLYCSVITLPMKKF